MSALITKAMLKIIPVSLSNSKIISIANKFDAMTSSGPTEPGIQHEKAVKITSDKDAVQSALSNNRKTIMCLTI